MLYTAHNKNFRHHVDRSLQRRIRLFLILSVLMFVFVIQDIANGTLGLGIALAALVVGGVVGFATSRIFHLSWKHDANNVVGAIDLFGWIVLVLYILFELLRTYLFSEFFPTQSPEAVSFAFIAAAFFFRVLGLRGRIIKVLREQEVFG